MSDLNTIFKIRLKGTKLYSRGRITERPNYSNSRQTSEYVVQYKSIGKEWKTEKALKDHLLKCIVKGIDMTDWEIMEFTQQPSRAMNTWFDAKMTMARLKHM
jgi:hypothetical protein